MRDVAELFLSSHLTSDLRESDLVLGLPACKVAHSKRPKLELMGLPLFPRSLLVCLHDVLLWSNQSCKLYRYELAQASAGPPDHPQGNTACIVLSIEMPDMLFVALAFVICVYRARSQGFASYLLFPGTRAHGRQMLVVLPCWQVACSFVALGLAASLRTRLGDFRNVCVVEAVPYC